MKNLIVALVVLFALSGCGFKFDPKELTIWNAKGDPETGYSCGDYMRVNSQGWIDKSYEVTFTDGQGLTHDLYGVKEIAVSDIPKTINAPMYGFQNDHYLGERYSDKPDGTQGDLIKEGDTVVKGENMARLVNGKWTPVKIPNPACVKQ